VRSTSGKSYDACPGSGGLETNALILPLVSRGRGLGNPRDRFRAPQAGGIYTPSTS